MKSRILIFSVAYEPLVGGAEIAVRNITDRLLDYEFDLITCRLDHELTTQEKIGNVNVYRVGFGTRLGRYLYPVFAFRLASKLHKQNPYHIVWAIMAAYASAAALLFLRRNPQVKFLLTLQEGDPISHIHRRVRAFRRSWQQIFKRADYVQAISNYLADWARAEGAVCPVEVVPNGVALENFQFPISNFQKNLKIIITTSRLVRKNGLDILIKAITVIASEAKQSLEHGIASSPDLGRDPRNDRNIKLVIIGSGPEERNLKTLAKKLQVNDVVEFLGDVSPNEIPKYLLQADIFVRASRSEGLGISFLEAMAAGVPVIATPVGGIPDFLKDRETGLFSKPEDPKDLSEKIKELLEDEELRKKLAYNARSLVEQDYDWNKIALRYESIIHHLIP